jgi:hypothetical protein
VGNWSVPRLTGKLPVRVELIDPAIDDLYAVHLVFADGTTGAYLIPEAMVTPRNIRIASLATAVALTEYGLVQPKRASAGPVVAPERTYRSRRTE